VAKLIAKHGMSNSSGGFDGRSAPANRDMSTMRGPHWWSSRHRPPPSERTQGAALILSAMPKAKQLLAVINESALDEVQAFVAGVDHLAAQRPGGIILSASTYIRGRAAVFLDVPIQLWISRHDPALARITSKKVIRARIHIFSDAE
jgi:hypothetical protein